MEKNCATDKAGQCRWGTDNWKIMKRRLASLAAVSTLAEMVGVPGRCHQLGGDRRGQFAVDLWGSYRLIFVPNYDPIPCSKDGGIERSLVTSILIVEVVDYHGD